MSHIQNPTTGRITAALFIMQGAFLWPAVSVHAAPADLPAATAQQQERPHADRISIDLAKDQKADDQKAKNDRSTTKTYGSGNVDRDISYKGPDPRVRRQVKREIDRARRQIEASIARVDRKLKTVENKIAREVLEDTRAALMDALADMQDVQHDLQQDLDAVRVDIGGDFDDFAVMESEARIEALREALEDIDDQRKTIREAELDLEGDLARARHDIEEAFQDMGDLDLEFAPDGSVERFRMRMGERARESLIEAEQGKVRALEEAEASLQRARNRLEARLERELEREKDRRERAAERAADAARQSAEMGGGDTGRDPDSDPDGNSL